MIIWERGGMVDAGIQIRGGNMGNKFRVETNNAGSNPAAPNTDTPGNQRKFAAAPEKFARCQKHKQSESIMNQPQNSQFCTFPLSKKPGLNFCSKKRVRGVSVVF